MIVLLYPSKEDPLVVPKFNHNSPVSHMYEEYGRWADTMQISTIGQLNGINRSERLKSYI